MFLDSKPEEPQSFISIPKFLVYHSFVSFKLSEEKKIPPIPVTLGVVSLVEAASVASFFCSSILFVVLVNSVSFVFISATFPFCQQTLWRRLILFLPNLLLVSFLNALPKLIKPPLYLSL